MKIDKHTNKATCIYHLLCLQVLQVFAITFEISGGVFITIFLR